MEEVIKISSHINKLIVYFGSYFNHDSMPRDECLKISAQSSLLHRQLEKFHDFRTYENHVILAKQVYRTMLNKLKNQKIINDIVFCGSTDRSWEETKYLIQNLYSIDINSKEVYVFYYLHEINNNKYIDSSLPSIRPTFL